MPFVSEDKPALQGKLPGFFAFFCLNEFNLGQGVIERVGGGGLRRCLRNRRLRARARFRCEIGP